MKFSKSVMSRLLIKEVDYFEKGRKPKWEKKRSVSEEREIMHPGGASDYMGNPGGSSEKQNYERTKADSIANLKKLSESKDPADRKAAQAGLKRHEKG